MGAFMATGMAVSDLEKATAFYVEVLGLKKLQAVDLDEMKEHLLGTGKPGAPTLVLMEYKGRPKPPHDTESIQVRVLRPDAAATAAAIVERGGRHHPRAVALRREPRRLRRRPRRLPPRAHPGAVEVIVTGEQRATRRRVRRPHRLGRQARGAVPGRDVRAAAGAVRRRRPRRVRRRRSAGHAARARRRQRPVGARSGDRRRPRPRVGRRPRPRAARPRRQPVPLSRARGKKVLLVAWASW